MFMQLTRAEKSIVKSIVSESLETILLSNIYYTKTIFQGHCR